MQIMDDEQLRAWASDLIRGQQEAENYAVVSIHLEAGRITRAKIEISEKPPKLTQAQNKP